MKLSELGEFAFIDHFAPRFTGDLKAGVLGIGDDCAVIPLGKDRVTLVTTDMLIEDSHFLRSRIPPEDLGYKSLAVNLSDIAGMGGTPAYAFLSLGMPADVDVEWMDRFFSGMYTLCRETAVQLLGGDTTRSGKHLVINIGVIGTAVRKQVKYRSGARNGDLICVTGDLGDSGAGLRLLLENRTNGRDDELLITRHHRPRAHLQEGTWLSKREDVHAMMDVSDGIDSDLRRIMERSGCGVRVDLRQLPCSEALRRVCAKYQWDMSELAATGGEDYCLLCTVGPNAYPALNRTFRRHFNRDLVRIGEITGGNALRYFDGDKEIRLTKHGFDHFA